MARHVSIMGATGSVGRSALAFIAHANAVADEPVFSIGALSANRDVARLAQQAIAFDADLAVIADESRYDDLKAALSGTGIKAASGAQALAEAASRPADRVLAGIVGIAGLHSTHDALAAGHRCCNRADRFGTQCHVPGHGAGRGCRKTTADRFRRAIPQHSARHAPRCNPGSGLQASALVDGTENLRR